MLLRSFLSLPLALRGGRTRCRTCMASTMTAIQVDEVGDESKLRLNTRAEIPAISPTECLVENYFAGLNFHDTYTRSGLYPLRTPFVVGCEGGGVVKEVGSEVQHVSVGDRVVYLQEGEHGSYAEFTNVEHTRLMPVPDNVELDVATAAAVQGLTAHYLVNDSYRLKEGDWCVIHAAAGGTGQILVQMAKAKGANVIGTCSTEGKAAVARARGCDFVILTKSADKGKGSAEDDQWPNVAAQVKQIITSNSHEPILPSNYGSLNINDGAHVVYDGVGKSSAMASLESLRPRGTCVFFGNASGAPPAIPPLLLSKLGSLTMTRPKMHDFIQTRADVVDRSSDVFDMLRRQEIDFTIQEKIPLSREGVIQGTRLLENRKTMGKIIFDIKELETKKAASKCIMASRRACSGKISNLSKDVAPSTIDDAYLTQEFVKNILLENVSGTKEIGFKIAATSKMAQESVSVTEPFYGSLFSHSTFDSPATISVKGLGLQDGFMLIEPEFAFKMKDDMEVSSDYTVENIKHHIGAVIPSVEIATSAYKMNSLNDFKKVGAKSLIADNACHGCLILGKEVSEEAGDDFASVLNALDRHIVILDVNGESVAQGSGDKVLGHPLNALCWFANELGKKGKAMRKGDIITTGVVVDGLVLVKSGDSVSVDYGNMGKVDFIVVE